MENYCITHSAAAFYVKMLKLRLVFYSFIPPPIFPFISRKMQHPSITLTVLIIHSCIRQRPFPKPYAHLPTITAYLCTLPISPLVLLLLLPCVSSPSHPSLSLHSYLTPPYFPPFLPPPVHLPTFPFSAQRLTYTPNT